MTSKKPKDINWPVPLRERDNSLGVAVREYAQSTEETRGDAAVYTRVLAQVGRRSRRVPMIAAGLATAGVLAVVALVVLHRDAAVPTGTVASKSALFVSAPSPRLASTEAPPPTAQPSRTPPVSTPPIASIRLGTLPASLPAGTVDLVGQATAVLSPDAVASGRARAGNTEVVLSKGSIELRVLPRAPGQQFTVNAGPYRFTVVGIAFTVSQTRSRIELVVSEGKVVVSRGTKRLATVGAGAEWAVDMNSAANSAARKFVAGGAAELTVAEPVAGAGADSRSRVRSRIRPRNRCRAWREWSRLHLQRPRWPLPRQRPWRPRPRSQLAQQHPQLFIRRQPLRRLQPHLPLVQRHPRLQRQPPRTAIAGSSPRASTHARQ